MRAGKRDGEINVTAGRTCNYSASDAPPSPWQGRGVASVGVEDPRYWKQQLLGGLETSNTCLQIDSLAETRAARSRTRHFSPRTDLAARLPGCRSSPDAAFNTQMMEREKERGQPAECGIQRSLPAEPVIRGFACRMQRMPKKRQEYKMVLIQWGLMEMDQKGGERVISLHVCASPRFSPPSSIPLFSQSSAVTAGKGLFARLWPN